MTTAALRCLFPSAVLGKVSPDLTRKVVSFLGSPVEIALNCQCLWSTLPLVSLGFGLRLVKQPYFRLCEVCCQAEAHLYNEYFIPHWQITEKQGFEEGLWDCFLAFCSLVINENSLAKFRHLEISLAKPFNSLLRLLCLHLPHR